MYLTFYGLQEKPFNSTPDPRFLFMTAGHREGLAQLVYGVEEQKGFIVLTGEVGTGKTTLLHALLKRLEADTAVSFIFNSALSFDEILQYMLKDFGIPELGDSRVERLIALNNFLIERRRAGQNTVVIFDEAQNLEPPILEQIRLLSNFETPTEKLLQIVLVGQPELKTKLQISSLRQLRQRIGLRCNIPALTEEETRDYIRTRLRIAGARDLRIFTDAAVRRIAQYAGGIPRMINILCDHCLITGYARQKRRIEKDIVEEAIHYLDEGERPSFSRRLLRPPARWVVGAAVAATLIGVVGVASMQGFLGGRLEHFARAAWGLFAP